MTATLMPNLLTSFCYNSGGAQIFKPSVTKFDLSQNTIATMRVRNHAKIVRAKHLLTRFFMRLCIW